MTSVAVISSAVARINCLKELLKSLPDETDALLVCLQAIKELLEAGGCKNAKLEREIVRLSYDIVDAIADASYPAKDKPKKATTKLLELKEQLSKSHEDLKKNNPESTTPQGSEVEQQEHEQRYAGINPFRRNKNKSAASPKKNPESTMAPQGSEVLQKQESKRWTYIGNPFRNRSKSESTTPSEIPVGPAGQQKENPESTTSEDLQAGPKQNSEEEEEAGTKIDLLQRLKESSSTVLYIVGGSGMGKSTFARTLFDQLKKDSSFSVCAWVRINHNFHIRKVLRILLQKLAPRQEIGVKDMTEIELIAQIFAALNNKAYLLVLDDVKSVDDWESIRLALPISGSTRVIITSSCMGFTPFKDVCKISRMTLPSILELLEKEGSFKPGSDEVGKTIFEVSGGSPLLATILSKSLQSEANAATQQMFLEELNSYKSLEGGSKVLAACYKLLAPEIKSCLLYLSQFPRGQDIEFEKLYLLLVAENLIIPPKESQKTALQSLMEHLEELARRKLVEVQENTQLRRGNNKSYKLQFQLQKFCKLKASEEEFLEIVDMKSPTKVGLHTRRLAIHLSKDGGNTSFIQFESQETLKQILSLLIFDTSESAEDKSEWPKEINDLKEFIHLRILKFDGVSFGNAPTGIDTLVLLRYLSFRGCRLEELPSFLSKLTQLETLDLVVQSDCKMLIPNDILTDMKRMVHLYFPRLYKRSEKTKLQLPDMERLEILVNFDMEVCDVEAISKFNKLRILSTMSNGDPKDLNAIVKFIEERANLLEYSSVDIRSFDCYDKARVSALEKLLQCEYVDSIHIEGQIGKLPEGDERTKRVVDIVLDGSEIEADPMEYLGMFEKMQSLVLKNDAFVENEIVVAAGKPFPNLRRLKLQNLKYLKKLTIEEGAMPELSTMQIDSCNSLQELSIPKELDDRLKKAQGDDRGYAYSIMPMPPKFKITVPDKVHVE